MNKHFGASEVINKARAVPIEREIKRRGIKLQGTIERYGPCPKCGGDDRFSINTKKQCWNCRGCSVGGDVIKLVQHLDGVDFVSAYTTLAGEPPAKSTTKAKKVVAAEYRYEDENGDLVFMVKRLEYQRPDGTYITNGAKRKKTFSQCRLDPDKGQWIWNVDGIAPLLYRLPELLDAVANDRMIIIVEGEQKVDLLHSWNVPATCNAGGAKKWKAEHTALLAGADVVIVPDNDQAGEDHVEVVANSLAETAASIRVLKLPGLKAKGDIVDWAAAGGTVEQLHTLIEQDARYWAASELNAPRSPDHSDDALALEFAARYAADARFIAHRGKWLFWTSSVWLIDETLCAFDYARAICRDCAENCDTPRLAAVLASARTVAAVERMAKADRRIAATTEQWDADANIINTPSVRGKL